MSHVTANEKKLDWNINTLAPHAKPEKAEKAAAKYFTNPWNALI
tara:strand:- start:1468 stop:1599 length:132 start_codon:yes stop_codon:yes gene_type:complete